MRGAPTRRRSWQFVTSYRFGTFNHATKALGGSVTVQRFEPTTP